MQEKSSQGIGLQPFDLITFAPSENATSHPPIFSAVDFLVKISAMRERVQDLRESVPGFGVNTRESFAKYDHNSLLWKTSQRSFHADWEVFSEIWPRAGMMLSGIAYRLPCSVFPTSGIDYLSWPTPCTRDYKDTGANTDYKKIAEKFKLPGVVGGPLNPEWVEGLMGFPIGWTEVL